MASDFDQENEEKGKSSSSKRNIISLLILLLIICAGGYVYFFTCLIQPCEDKNPPPPVPVKRPLPKPHPVQRQISSNKEGGQQGEDQNLPNQPGAKGVKPAQNGNNAQNNAQNGSNGNNVQNGSNRPPQSRVMPPGNRPGQVRNQPVPNRLPPSPANVASQKPVPGVKSNQPAKTGSKAPGSVPANNRNVRQGTSGNVQASDETAENDNNAAVPKKTVPHRKVRRGIYILHVSDVVTPATANADKRRAQRAGLKVKVVKSAVKRNEPMTRLFVSSFDSRENAEAELNRLKEVTNDGFILLHDGVYSVYAGSYYDPRNVASEEQKLNNAGFAVTRQSVNVPLRTYKVSTGRFASRKAAQAEANRLRRAGMTVKIVKLR
ncbi:MAG: SPOR domain-containing protein [Desulfuromonadales bacterium]|nr:SPOR domain-containing protein [Desulfuromonadales bacterium]